MKYGLLCALMAFFSCQYPVSFSSLPDTHKFLVIDAEVTENFVQLNVIYSLEDVSSTGAYTFPKPPTTNAYLMDSKGMRYTFKNTTGVRDTLFRGRIGETYQLFVEADGKMYESKKEIMDPCPDLDTIGVSYRRETFRSPEDIFYDGLDVYVEARDIPGVDNFYQWTWTHYAKATYCNKVIDNFSKTEVLIPCNPPDCWNIETNRNPIVQSDKLRDGSPLVKFIARVPFAIPPNTYYLKIEQRAIPASVYDYLKSIEIQTQQIGTLFDIPAQTLFNPNVYNTSDKGEKLLGSFNVYSFRYKIININRDQVISGVSPKYIQSQPFIDDPFASFPCVESFNRTKVKPEGWIN